MTLLTVTNLSFSYHKSSTVFHDVNLSLEAGEVFTILGPNGVGKSTLLQCLCGLLTPTKGEISLNGQNISDFTHRQLARQVAIVPQNYHINSGITVMDYLLTGRTPYLSLLQMPTKKDHEIAEQYLTEFNLNTLKNRSFSSLSGGQQQLIAIIKSLLQEPKLLILDEPMAALDISRQYELLKLIKRLANKHIAILLTTHLPDHALMLNTKIGLLSTSGTLTTGSTDDLITKERLEELYKIPLNLTYLPELHRYTCQILI
ncbi:ABC transporter ATP-binding protein [Limosilactobacillus sp. STM2_1]|uniref:ABC transporter ATP-binding protein n=1 Tax=Limosilactobacillus rudii TaxID=2759755 RepID=A0A7W3YNZ2_9LACO|nr:ABC transporter ATP-binding protein [Limosilactobacillus rudii]MBB1078904.1 ABC transporter ATP-binding protein [Limosilactobacillus rudii]MBB1098220.1 ABC transporter ATP-binding protein [Limosilactobacillus rudii]MCD7135665.1 ABC transporter ATP-binding protein [Limosilactobacillus rudii]